MWLRERCPLRRENALFQTLSPPDHSPRGLDWVIAGGESGPKARPAHPEWFRSLRDQCEEAAVPYFFKQWGMYRPLFNEIAEKLERCIYINKDGCTWSAGSRPPVGFGDSEILDRVGKGIAGALLDGRLHREFPRGGSHGNSD